MTKINQENIIGKNNVFFFGAGFSKALVPESKTMAELTEYVQKRIIDKKDAQAYYLENEIPKQYKDNIENLMTYLSLSLPYKTEEQTLQDKSLYVSIVKIIADFFDTLNVDYKSCADKLKDISAEIWNNNSACITLNYDLILENLLREYLLKFNIGMSISFEEYNLNYFYKCQLIHQLALDGSISHIDGNAITADSVVNVIKLHGSINWYNDENSKNVYYYPEKNIKNIHLTPFIIPPILDKTRLYNSQVLKAVWTQAADALKKADNIFIIGFSFPSTDLSIKYLFQSALFNTTKNIYVVNTADSLNPDNKEYIKDKYTNLFAGHNMNFDYCCKDSVCKLNDLFKQ